MQKPLSLLLTGLLIAALPPCAVSAPADFPYLQPGFDSDFRFNNPLGASGKIAFTAKIGKFERILAVDLDQKRIYKLVDGPGNNSYPAWSPDGTKIAFTSDRDGNREIYVANADGSGQKRLTSSAVNDDNAAWSPDGKQVIFFTDNGKTGSSLQANIFSVSPAGGTPRRLTDFRGKNSTPRYSRDGKVLAYTTNRFWPGWDICLFDLASQHESCPLSGTSTFCRPDWSRSGKAIAFSTSLLGSSEGAIYTPATGSIKKLPATDGNQYDLAWSPDDKFIAFASDAEKEGSYDLWIFRLGDSDGGGIAPLLRSGHSIRYLSWTGSGEAAQ